MDLLITAITACSLYPNPTLVRALVDGQSQGAQFFVGDLTDLKSSTAPDATHAETLLSTIEKQHHRAALGLLGVPVEWAINLGRQPAELWDACVNLSVGTAKLSDFDYACRRFQASTRQPCVVRAFATALGLPSHQRNLFVRGILAILHRSIKPARNAPDEAASDPPTATWSSSLFFAPDPTTMRGQ